MKIICPHRRRYRRFIVLPLHRRVVFFLKRVWGKIRGLNKRVIVYEVGKDRQFRTLQEALDSIPGRVSGPWYRCHIHEVKLFDSDDTYQEAPYIDEDGEECGGGYVYDEVIDCNTGFYSGTISKDEDEGK